MDEFMVDASRRIRTSVQPPNGFTSKPTVPGLEELAKARASLPNPSDDKYLKSWGLNEALDHLLDDIAPALSGQSLSSTYWGFVTGGTLPIAEVADNIVSAYDQNVGSHLPTASIATEVEDSALKMILGLLDLGGAADWEGRTFTTGATTSNILGLACGRESVLQHRLSGVCEDGVGELGIIGACLKAGVQEIQVLTSMGHSSLAKAASIVGLGRSSVKELPYSAEEPWRLGLDAVEEELQRTGVASIISVSAGEVNTGKFATNGVDDMKRLRELADQYGAWIHVDGAFGIFARALPKTDEFSRLHELAAGLELADSITIDGHKLLNVPYDCGMFFTKKASTLTSVCANPNAAYLSTGASDIQTPLNIGLENSRRFRALPAYAVLISEGRERIGQMLARMVRTARGIAEVVASSSEYTLLPDRKLDTAETHICVLFKAKDEGFNEVLVDTINKTGALYVSGTKWKGQTAVRIAVANWRVNPSTDVGTAGYFLGTLAKEHKYGSRW